MLDIGQGDAFHIRTPQGFDIIVDGGPDRRVLTELGEVMPPYDHAIELVIATHPDADHIAGLTELPDDYTIERFISSGSQKSTGFSRELDTWNEQGVEVGNAVRGMRLDIEENVWLEFLHPDPPNVHEDPNDDSVMFILHYKQFSALFTGDAPTEIEDEIVEKYDTFGHSTLDVDLLKIGHHGSRTSTTAAFLEATTPSIALISVGVDNKFNHPHAGPLYKLNAFGIRVFRTDILGRIICYTDGNGIQCAPES